LSNDIFFVGSGDQSHTKHFAYSTTRTESSVRTFVATNTRTLLPFEHNLLYSGQQNKGDTMHTMTLITDYRDHERPALGQHFRYICTCGWEGPWYTDKHTAELELCPAAIGVSP